MIDPNDLRDPFLFNPDGTPRNLTWGISGAEDMGSFEKDLAELTEFLRKQHAEDPSVRIAHLGDSENKYLVAFGILKGGEVRPHQFWLSRVGHLLTEFNVCNRYSSGRK